MNVILWSLVAAPAVLAVYAYLGYPALLLLLARRRRTSRPAAASAWPRISITIPAYNEEAQIGGAIESLLQIDYPPKQRQILVVSDASTDRTDAIVQGYADRGVELLRLPRRSGKGAAEVAASAHLRGEIVVNTDASIRIRRDSLKALIARFADPTVGLASGRDVSVADVAVDGNLGESGYVGYEMWIRRLETRVHGIIGASGCFYAVRAHLHRVPLPDSLSRDFASAMIAREHGYRAVSVDEAVCLVPRTSSIDREYRRKVRTITRGMETLYHKRHLLNPLSFGHFAWMLFSHKVCRWLVPWSVPPALAALAVLSAESTGLRVALGLLVLAGASAGLGWQYARHRPLPRILSLPVFALAGNVAVVHAGLRVLRGDQDAIWEPTRRRAIAT